MGSVYDTHRYLGELPNTYVFTKQLAEHVMAEQRGKLPVVIMRPSIGTNFRVDWYCRAFFNTDDQKKI